MKKQTSFDSMNVGDKYNLLKRDGTFVASRIHGSYQVHLFTLEGKYIEMWRPVGMDYVQWIERVSSKETLDSYLDSFTINWKD